MTQSDVQMTSMTPILRIFDVSLARQFYIDFLGFKVDWEHRYEPDMPIYFQVSYGQCEIHLSEHFGDGSPGTFIRMNVKGLDQLHKSLHENPYKYARPGIEIGPGGLREITVNDPFGNKIIFAEQP